MTGGCAWCAFGAGYIAGRRDGATVAAAEVAELAIAGYAFAVALDRGTLEATTCATHRGSCETAIAGVRRVRAAKTGVTS